MGLAGDWDDHSRRRTAAGLGARSCAVLRSLERRGSAVSVHVPSQKTQTGPLVLPIKPDGRVTGDGADGSYGLIPYETQDGGHFPSCFVVPCRRNSERIVSVQLRDRAAQGVIMMPARPTMIAQHITDILLKADAAQEEMYLYYKFGRYQGEFPEKPYLLMSHAAHLLFSLWAAEQESGLPVLTSNARLAILSENLNLGALRYAAYTQQTHHPNAFDEHFKNESQWFRVWIDAMERPELWGESRFREVSQHMQSLVCHPDFLDGRISQNDRKVLCDLMLTREGGELLCRSVRFLEELVSAVALFLAALDPRINAIEHVFSLVCMLKRMRQIVLYETAARGPYAPLVDGRWGAPPLRTLLRNYLKPCFLTVVPKRDGGGFVCTCSWSPGSKQRGQTWVRSGSSLKQPYEEKLFKTWAYETGEYLLASGRSANIKARWVLQNAEAQRLETATCHIEMVLRRLSIHTAWSDLMVDIAAVARPSRRVWRAGRIPWTYVTVLDDMIAKLKLGCRQLQACARMTAPEKVVELPWPSQFLAKPRAVERRRHSTATTSSDGERGDRAPASKDTRCAVASAGSQTERPDRPARRRAASAGAQPDSERTTPPMPPEAATETSGPLVIEDKAIPSSPEAALQALCRAMADGDESNESEDVPRVLSEQEPDAAPSASTREQRVDGDPAPEAPTAPQTSRDVVLERLSKWHGIAEGQINYRPMSLRQLQNALGWKQTKVRKVMTKIFGKRPFTNYRKLCADEAIGGRLLEWLEGRTEMCESLAGVDGPDADEQRSAAGG